MNAIEGRGEEAVGEAGTAGCREHPASGRTSRKVASPYLSDLRKRSMPPSGKKYTRTVQGMRLPYHNIGAQL